MFKEMYTAPKMNMQKIESVSKYLLILVFLSPLLGLLLSYIGQDSEAVQYAGLQGLLMGVYNLPFLVVSLLSFMLGSSFLNKGKNKSSTITFMISILSSIIGTIHMLAWGVGAL